MYEFGLAFLAIFVAMDVFGVLPVYLGLSSDLDPSARRRLNLQAMLTALAAGVAFMFIGATLFEVLHIQFGDFRGDRPFGRFWNII